jgi:hypothetical protein
MNVCGHNTEAIYSYAFYYLGITLEKNRKLEQAKCIIRSKGKRGINSYWKRLARNPNIKIQVLKHTYEMLSESRMMYFLELLKI